MLEKIDEKLIHIMIDVEVQAETPKKEIIEMVQKKYPKLSTDFIAFHILKRRKEWIRKLLESYHSLSSWGTYQLDLFDDGFGDPTYKIYKDVPDGHILKMILEEALEEYGKKDPKLRALLVMRYIDAVPATIKEIRTIFGICTQTVYNWLERALYDLCKIMYNKEKTLFKAV